MLETIREYAEQELRPSGGGADIARRHAEWFARLLEEAELLLEGQEQTKWLDRLNRENDNVRSALQWARDAREAVLALRLASAFGSYWWVRGQSTEGRMWLQAALALPGGQEPVLRSRALEEAAHLAYRQGDYSRARLLADESMQLASEQGDAGRPARTLRVLALVAAGEGDNDRFRRLVEQSASAARDSGDRWALMMALNNLGCIALEAGDTTHACAHLEEAFELAATRGDERGEAFVLENLAFAKLMARRPRDARADFARSLRAAHRLSFLEVVAMDLTGAAAVALADGECVCSAHMLGVADRLLDEIGSPRDVFEERVYVETLARLDELLGTEGLRQALEEGRQLPLGEAVELALASLD